ncbi:MAG: 8-amino-7-oxononanoate synthase [Verrucomicrobiota bacterium]|nr:8-amino-7-oxononanoate synthase [Verrucomicrobiota bacterium]
MGNFEKQLDCDLGSIRDSGLWRELRYIESAQGSRIEHNGKKLINFSSNDYLGLAVHPVLVDAVRKAMERFGVGSGASRLVCGSLKPHHELEEALADWLDAERALVFSSGFAAAQGVITSLVGRGDVVIVDKKVHASTVDAAKLSGATIRVFQHNDLLSLEKILKWADSKNTRILTITESVFSMDGDSPEIEDLVELKERYGSWLMLDEAHALGCYGEAGSGLALKSNLADRIEIRLGTLGKSVGAAGGFVCGSQRLVDLLVNKARSFIFSTAPSPLVSAAALAGVNLIQSNEGEVRRHQLWENVAQFQKGVASQNWPVPPAMSVILPLILRDESKAMSAMNLLRDSGLYIPAIRFPTVPRNEARLRITVSASHTRDDIAALLTALDGLLVEVNL